MLAMSVDLQISNPYNSFGVTGTGLPLAAEKLCGTLLTASTTGSDAMLVSTEFDSRQISPTLAPQITTNNPLPLLTMTDSAAQAPASIARQT